MLPSNPRLQALPLLALIVGLGLAVYVGYTQKVVDGWDPLAYLYASERIVHGQGPTLCHPFNEEIGPYFTMAGFNVRVQEGPCLSLNYPPGFPLLLAAAHALTGLPDAALYVPALLGALGLVVTCALGTVLFDRWVGLGAAVIVALLPTYLGASTSPWSDLAGTVFLTAAITLFLWGERLNAKRKRWPALVAVLAAVLATYSLLARYSNVVVLFPLVLYVLLSQKRRAFTSTSHWLFAALMALGLVGVLWFNRAYYGGHLTTGYSPRHGWYTWPAFSLQYALGSSPVGGESLRAGFQTLVENLGLLLLPACIGLLTMPRYKRLLIAGLVLAVTLFYGLYAFAPEGINARFLLPAFPALAIAASFGLRYGVLRWGWAEWRGRLWVLAGGALFMIAVGLPLADRLSDLQVRNSRAIRHVQATRSLVENSESDAVFLAYGLNDAIYYYGERTSLFYRRLPPLDPVTGAFRWDRLEPLLVDVVTRLLERDVPVYYVQDSDPPFANSLALLRRHFILNAWGSSPPVFRVQFAAAGP